MPIATHAAPTPGDATHLDVDPWPALASRLTAFVRRRIGDPHAAEDVGQEVLLRLYRNLDQLRGADRPEAFAYRIARNAIIDHYRSTAGAKELPSAPEDLVERIDAGGGAGDESHSGASSPELAPCLKPLVGRLPHRYRQALTLTDLGALSQVQAAQVVGLTIPGMKARVQRGRAQLRELLVRCCDIARDDRRRITAIQPTGFCSCCEPSRPTRAGAA